MSTRAIGPLADTIRDETFNETRESTERGEFTCKACGKTFGSKDELTEHQTVHAEARVGIGDNIEQAEVSHNLGE